ncbi:hypothetical protein [Rubrobacter indicoceani]|uniref:hypothetical protein n=1 Tax=Rubrobacter indicoceani TaxID=2051957 RepID=UPI000E5B4CEF|nr:hypothetical protein [Rubrobacter indicoceani]
MIDGQISEGWRDLAHYLSALAAGERESVSAQTGWRLSEDPEETLRMLAATLDLLDGAASDFAALAGVRLALEGGDRGLATKLGEVAVQLAGSVGERQLAHACLAQSAFRFRKDPESLAAFERHCEAAIALEHAGTFCYERLAVLYEYRGETESAVEVCEKAAAALSASGDGRSAERFRKKAQAIRNRKNKSG